MSEIVVEADGEQFLEPSERARVRLERLTRSFADIIETIALMYRDEDWRHVFRDDGTSYGSLAELVSDVLNTGMAMARRYIQGARDFYLPLSQITVDGTSIEITSSDVRALGSTGLRDVVTSVTPQLEDVDDPEISSSIIAGAVSAARSAREQPELISEEEARGEQREVPAHAMVVAVQVLAGGSGLELGRLLAYQVPQPERGILVKEALATLRQSLEPQ